MTRRSLPPGGAGAFACGPPAIFPKVTNALPPPAKLLGLRGTAFVMTIGGLLLASQALPRLASSILTDAHPVLVFLWTYTAICLVFLGIGLERRNHWAWDGTVYSIASVTLFLLVLPVALLNSKNSKPATAIVELVFFLLLTIPPLLLLRYLIRPNVRSAFEPAEAQPGGHPVPNVWIRLIAMGSVLSAGSCLAEPLDPARYPLFGLTSNSVAVWSFAILSVFVMVYAGLGLYRLNDSARRLLVAFLILSLMKNLMWVLYAPAPTGRFTALRIAVLLLSTIVDAPQVWYLHTRRQLFRPQI